ncbi:GIY-YIG nuclease family protein [Cellvibrio sp. OA-2007]|uniref:GIY-YIG nuclease family protein n=1 Tax=Cellvibrio sp. OA-2007 TaxID=529823 RepID=UPI000784895A|nr:GIY-YIG nuclease family protein [Cellvibrio sp. OA-2007]
MPINQYEHDFNNLVNVDFKKYVSELEKLLESPIAMSEFAIKGVGVVSIVKKLGLTEDFSGLYVLLEKTKPIYVGISRSVIQRLRQHVRGTTHFDASLAYRIASKNMNHSKTRSEAMESEEFKKEFNAAQLYLRGLNVAYVNIANPLALYVFEPFCAMKYDTEEWNTFETH